MIRFRFSILLLCVILPPILYIAAMSLTEDYAAKRLRTDLERSYLGNVQVLLDGAEPIQRAIPVNIERALAQSRWLAWGAKASVTVRTGQNTLLYPADVEALQSGADLETPARNIATENYRLINQGLKLSLDFKLPHNTLLANLLLGISLLLPLAGLLVYYRRWSLIYHQENRRRTRELERLSNLENQYQDQLRELQTDRRQMAADIETMKARLAEEKKKADASEEEMLEEIITLEEKIEDREAAHRQQLDQIKTLEEKLAQLTAPHPKEGARKNKPADMARKRLTTLYKGLDIHQRAVEGYAALTEELKIKAEEVLVQLNDDPATVQIKRKVFGKKNRLTVLEVVFGYKGRLYFRSSEDRQVEVLVIGTKNSQQQDLGYLERL